MNDSQDSARRVSMRDLAKRLGISHSTVSLALRDSPKITPEVRERVKAEAAAAGYRPDPMLAALSQYSRSKAETLITSSIAWINAWTEPEKLLKHREFAAYWRGARAAAEKFGFRLEEFRLDRDCSPRRLHQILQARGIQGLLLPPHGRQTPDWGDFPWEHYAVVRFGRSLTSPACHIVTADQVANTMLAFKSMCDRGYRRIGFVTGGSYLGERGRLFELGYLAGQQLENVGERLPIFFTGRHPDNLQEAFGHWYREHRPDAVFTDLGNILPLLESAGIRVPEEVGLAGTSIHDTEATAGIDQHPEEIGREGVLMLQSLLCDNARGIPKIFRQILIEGGWVDGGTLPRRDPVEDALCLSPHG